MKIKAFNIVIALVSSIAFAQVGIGTLNPQVELHISGSKSTIRIESLNSENNPIINDGSKIIPLSVDGKGNVCFDKGFGASEKEPLNFLIDVPNFIADDPYELGFGSGVVVNNNNSGETTAEGEIARIEIHVPHSATVEVKYGITLLIAGANIASGTLVYAAYNQTVSIQTYFCVDIDGNGLDVAEKARRHGYKGLSYETNYGGSIGYPYMNSQGYLSLPAGTHQLYFYGVVNDAANKHTSVGFGGDKDFLKIRVYN